MKVTACVFRVFDGKMMIKIKIYFLFAFLGLDIFLRCKTLLTCLAARSLLCLEEAKQAQQKLDAVQDHTSVEFKKSVLIGQ